MSAPADPLDRAAELLDQLEATRAELEADRGPGRGGRAARARSPSWRRRRTPRSSVRGGRPMHSPDELQASWSRRRSNEFALLAGARTGRRTRCATRSRWAASVCGPVICLATGRGVRRARRAGDAGRARDRARPQLLARPRRPALRSTTTRSAAASRASGPPTARERRCWRATACSPRRSGSPARIRSPHVARELAEMTLGMIGGQYLDTMVDGADLTRPCTG